MSSASGYAAHGPTTPLVPFRFERRALRPQDVRIAIGYCGVCHSDLHEARNDWKSANYPMVPGHEIVGKVIATGEAVQRFKTGDRVAVGCLIDSCLSCEQCKTGAEQYCLRGSTGTYNDRDRVTGDATYGGYSDEIVVRQEFVLRLPEALDMARAAPLLCAGITTYSALRHWKVARGQKVGIVGLGGLGHMGVKIAAALGAEVTVLTRSPAKSQDARALGARHVLLSADDAAMQEARGTLDFVLDTVPVAHDVVAYLRLLRTGGACAVVGAVDTVASFHSEVLLTGRRSLAGSMIGGIAETQEMLDFCAENAIEPDCEMIAIQDINTAFARMERGDVKYRFVIDMASLRRV